MRLRHFFCISAILFFYSTVKSQDSIRCGNWLSADAHYGFIVPLYSNSMTYLLRAHVPGIEVDYLHKSPGTLPWEQTFHCPETGFAFFYAWLGNPAELGNMIGAYPFINFHLQRSYREAIYLRVGMGLGYMPVIFDRLNNYKDNVIGSHLNVMVNLRFTSHFYLSDKIRLETGLGLTHCSDGNFKTPNLGINLVTVNTGLSYGLNTHRSAIKVLADSNLRKKPENDLIAGVGLSQIEPPGGHYFGAITLSYLRYYFLGKKSKLGGGLDIFYNNANIAKLAADSIYLKSSLENIQVGIKVNYELTIGKLSLPMEMGKYLYTKTNTPVNMYNRFGLRYYIKKHLILNLTLLTHFASAVYIEWGMGYKF